MIERLQCCVPYCRRSTKLDCEEWICGKHWPLVSRSLKNEWSSAKRQARKIVARKPLYQEWWKYPGGSSDRLAAIRMWKQLDAIWQRCRMAAIEGALGI